MSDKPRETGGRADVAYRLFELTRSRILMRFRFLTRAMSMLAPKESESVRFACDGEHIYYSSDAVIESLSEDKNYLNRLCLHCMLHCLLGHMYMRGQRERAHWDLACDMAAEAVILDLEEPMLSSLRDGGERKILSAIRDFEPVLTAQTIYRYLAGHAYSEEKLRYLCGLFAMDDHDLWYGGIASNEEEKEKKGGAAGGEEGRIKPDRREEAASKPAPPSENEEHRRMWEKIGKRALMELYDFIPDAVSKTEVLSQSLHEFTDPKYDYRHFLERFFVRHEEMQINQDEFDLIFYIYGLGLYGNVPLLEPLEYREEKKLKEFVIVLDTSASVRGETVKRFLEHTLGILRQSEHFFSGINLHFIQCDCKVQEDRAVTSAKEAEEYVRNLDIRGMGSTDFRPAFSYVSKLAEKGEFRNLSGLLYFTDGEGIYPERKPPFETAFVFLKDHYRQPKVPPWAIKIIVDENEFSRGSLRGCLR